MPDKRATFEPIDTIDGFQASSVGATSLIDPNWDTLFSQTLVQLPPGFYLLFYDFVAECTVTQKPIESRILFNGVIPSLIHRAPLLNVDERETFSLTLFLTHTTNNDLLMDFQFRLGLGGGGGATLTVDTLQLFVQMQTKRQVIPPIFTSGQAVQSLGVQV